MRKLLPFLVLFCVSFLLVPCQGQTLDAFQSNMENYVEQRPQEKLHVHTDREIYGAGETIWYKIYATIGLENNLSILSNIGYVELLDPVGESVSRKINTLFSGVAVGEMALADTLTEGSYRLRAYTNWMRNDSSDYFFEKVLQIGNRRADDILSTTKLVEDNGTSFYEIELQSPNGEPWPRTYIQYNALQDGESVDKGRESLSPEGIIRIKVNEKNKGRQIALRFASTNESTVKKLISTDKFFKENSLQIFPEAGQIVGNEMNRLAFKAINPEGLGIPAEITILNSSKDTIAQLSTNPLGMGSVPCYIADGDQYTVETTFEDGTISRIPVPQPTSEAISMAVNASQSEKIFAQVNLSPNQINDQDIYLGLQHLGTIFYMAKQKANQKNVLFTIPKQDLPMGVMTLTLLNQNLVPLVERPIFNYNPDRLLPVVVKQDQSVYGTREKVTNTLIAGNDNDSVRMAAISASVINLDRYQKEAESGVSLLSSLLLQADLQGFIENPSYYFDDQEGFKAQELDDLLLTQGWRRLHIQQLDSIQTAEPRFQAEKGLSIQGYTRKIGRKTPSPNATVQLISTHNFMDFIDTTSNDDGRFSFDELIFPDSIKFLISAKDQKGKNNIDIITDPFLSPNPNLNQNAPLVKNDINRLFDPQFQADKQFYKELENKGLMDNVLQIEEVVVTAQQPKAAENSSNLNGPGNADQVVTADDLSTCSTLEICLAGRLTGVYFQGGVPYNTRGNVPMQVVLDGMYMDEDALTMISPMDVQSVEVLRNANYTTIYGSYGAGGLIIITSKTGRDARASGFQPRGLLAVQPKGVAISKEFYKPVYEPGSQTQFQKDLRTTIHWEPSIVTDETGTATFDFYTSDEPGTYRMIIEGVDLNGRLLHRMEQFEVK
ncbi:MAG: TonB-dependent receptor plug domain-containing protein [Sphingobacterium sp.]